jgi:hypothetical protein
MKPKISKLKREKSMVKEFLRNSEMNRRTVSNNDIKDFQKENQLII